MRLRLRTDHEANGLCPFTLTRKLPWPPDGLTTEILRLLVLCPHDRAYYQALGLGIEETAAYRYLQLQHGGHRYQAQHGRRLCGLLDLVERPWDSAMLDRRVWSIGQLVISPEAPADTVPSLLRYALSDVSEPIDFISASVPGTDTQVIRGLRSFGFRAVADQQVAVIGRQALVKPEPSPIRIGPMQRRHWEEVAAIARDCSRRQEFPRPGEPDREEAGALQVMQVVGYSEDPHRTMLVAQNGSGRVLGFIGMRLEEEALDYTDRRLARIEQLGIRPDLPVRRLERLLHFGALEFLFRKGVDAVSFALTVRRPWTEKTLDMLRSIGYRTRSGRLVLHCGPKTLSRRLRPVSPSPETEAWMNAQRALPAGSVSPRVGKSYRRVSHAL